MTAPRYLLCPGWVRQRHDGQWHMVGAGQLAGLYGVPMGECLVLPSEGFLGGGHAIERRDLLARVDRGELVALRARSDGDYTLP